MTAETMQCCIWAGVLCGSCARRRDYASANSGRASLDGLTGEMLSSMPDREAAVSRCQMVTLNSREKTR